MEDLIKISKKKLVYPINDLLRKYLKKYQREVKLPLSYNDLTNYQESIPLLDKNDKETLWETVIYPSYMIDDVHKKLKIIYAIIRANGDLRALNHLFVDRIDYCTFGNTNPFRIRIVNRYNDVYDYIYIKVADASRVCGLELEHLLSPNQLNYLVDEHTLVEEHIAGIPGDQFAKNYLNNPEYNVKRLAKDFVKFNERCMIRLLGDMRAYNFVLVVTPDFDDYQFRIRPIDFDQQFYEGQLKVYQPQFFKENYPYVQLALQYLNKEVIEQYRQEERAVIIQRVKSERHRLAILRDILYSQEVSSFEKVKQLREESAAYYEDPKYLECEHMAAILDWNLKRLIFTKRHLK
jgi:hypothetical protein